MNIVMACGNLTDDPKVTTFDGGSKKAEWSLALNRLKDGADFPKFGAWNEKAEFVEKYFHKGMKMLVRGHIQTGSYTNKEGKKVYTTEVMADEIEFVEKKKADGSEGQPEENPKDEWMNIPDVLQEELPFQ